MADYKSETERAAEKLHGTGLQGTGLVKYETKGGQEISLSPSIVRKYLVQGKSEFVTDQEIMYFMAISKARGLNPFIKDAYLIKYSPNDNAQIITSIDFFRKRARAQTDCHGWQAGIIVQTKEGEVKYSKGLILEGEKLLGGWFKAIPAGWDVPFELEINLKGYVKHKRDGSITSFWQEDNQPSQIRKVAESQGLRTVWPDEFQQLYTDVEMGSEQQLDFKDAIDIIPEETPGESDDEETKTTPPADVAKAISAQSGLPVAAIREFISFIAKRQEKTEKWVEENAMKAPDSFIRAVRNRLETLEKAAAGPKEKAPDAHEKLIKEFWNLRVGSGGKTGLKAFVTQNMKHIYEDYPEPVMEKLKEKFQAFYPGETFPAPAKKQEAPPAEDIKVNGQDSPQAEERPSTGAGGADAAPPFSNPNARQDYEAAKQEQSHAEEIGQILREHHDEGVDLLARYENSVESVMKFNQSGIKFTYADFESYMKEMAHMEGVAFSTFKADVMRTHAFPDYYDQFEEQLKGQKGA